MIDKEKLIGRINAEIKEVKELTAPGMQRSERHSGVIDGLMMARNLAHIVDKEGEANG